MFPSWKRLLGWAALAAIALFGLIQLVPVARFQTNSPVLAEPNWDSPETRALAKAACFDCHSNETVWPWYAKVAPISWLVTRDTVEGRQRLNFSEWGVPRPAGEGGEGGGGRNPADEIAEQIREGEMPPGIYLLPQPAARLTDAQKEQLIRGLEASLR